MDSIMPINQFYRNTKITPQEKLVAVERIKGGETKASVSRDINVPESTLRGWCKGEERIRFIVDRELFEKTMDLSSPASQSQHHQIESNVSNGWPTTEHNNHVSSSNDSDSAMDLTISKEKCYGSLQSNEVIDYSMKVTQSNVNPSVPSRYLQKNEMWTQHVDCVTNIKRPASDSNNQFIGSNSPYYPYPSHSSTLPLIPIPETSQAQESYTQHSMLLWHMHALNQSVNEKIAYSSPTSPSNMDLNLRLPDGLTIRPSPVVHPIEDNNSVKLLPQKSLPKLELIANQKPDAIGEKVSNFDNNNTDSNNNENNDNKVVENRENDSGVISPWEAIKCAEKFSKWFEAYTDPTLTTQDVMRFDQLYNKVKKIVERLNNGNVKHLQHKRK